MKPEGPRVIAIVGPEGTELRFPLADAFSRFAAFSVDACILVLTIGVVLCGLVGSLTLGESFVTAIALVLSFAVRHGYFLFFETVLQGATPCKRLMKLRVVSRDGGRLRLEAIVARNLMRDLEVFVPMVVLISPESVVGPAPWWMRTLSGLWALAIGGMPLYTREGARAGDLIGGTVVVAIPQARLLRDQSSTDAPEAVVFDRQQLAVYGEHELETLAELLRAYEQDRAKVEDLRLVAGTIARKIGFEGREPSRDPHAFLQAFYRAQRAELEKRLLLGKRKTDKHDPR